MSPLSHEQLSVLLSRQLRIMTQKLRACPPSPHGSPAAVVCLEKAFPRSLLLQLSHPLTSPGVTENMPKSSLERGTQSPNACVAGWPSGREILLTLKAEHSRNSSVLALLYSGVPLGPACCQARVCV